MKKLSKPELIEICQGEEYLWNFTDHPGPLLYTQPTKTMYIGYATDSSEQSMFSKLGYAFKLINEHPQWAEYPKIKHSLVHHVPKKEYVVLLPQTFKIAIFSTPEYFPNLLRKRFSSVKDFHTELSKAFGENLNYQHLTHAISKHKISATAFSSNKIDIHIKEVLAKTVMSPLDAIMTLLDPEKNNISLVTQPTQVSEITHDMIWWTDSPCVLVKASHYSEIRNTVLTS